MESISFRILEFFRLLLIFPFVNIKRILVLKFRNYKVYEFINVIILRIFHLLIFIIGGPDASTGRTFENG